MNCPQHTMKSKFLKCTCKPEPFRQRIELNTPLVETLSHLLQVETENVSRATSEVKQAQERVRMYERRVQVIEDRIAELQLLDGSSEATGIPESQL